MMHHAEAEPGGSRRTATSLRDDALAIWHAAVEAVRSDRLVASHVRVENGQLHVGSRSWPLARIRRLIVVGAGKAGAGMAAGLEAALGDEVMERHQLTGWVNVPADCVRPLRRIHLHAARPAGMNEPTEAGCDGARRILQLVREATADDVCLCLISGGGSALLPAPVPGVTVAEKQVLTKFLSAAGANIRELNTVRKQLSLIKGGGLARSCRAGHLISLIISDVLGDPLDIIASGPTVADPSTPQDALDVLTRFEAASVAPAAWAYLQEARRASLSRRAGATEFPCAVENHVIGNNAVAVDAAGIEAERRGYSYVMVAARQLEGAAEEIGRHLADQAVQLRSGPGVDCFISGGEPTVKLADPSIRGLGGRSQQLVLAALCRLLESQAGAANPLEDVVLLSGGTDGEDGPTDAAGAWIDATSVPQMRARGLDPADYLRRNDAYRFFDAVGGLLRTGPTHTNACDVRVVLIGKSTDKPQTHDCQIKLFAVAKSIVGRDAVTVPLPAAATVADLRAALNAAYPALASVSRHFLFAVNAEYATDSTVIPPGATVACIPPVSGG